MKSKVEKSENYKWAIVVDEKDLRRLDETIKSTLSSPKKEDNIKLKYKIKCSDGSKIETNNINDVANEENSKIHSIENIDIVANNQESTNEINVSLGSSFFETHTISYSITGDSRDWVYLTTSKIEERVKSLKQWYSFFLKINFEWLWFLIVVFFIGFINLQPSKQTRENISLSEYIPVFSIIFAVIIAIFIAYKTIKYCYNYLFPLTIFRIGEGIRRHDAIISLREKLFWGIFIALLISIISGMILIKIV